jgi:hypothetical protein
MKKGLRICEKLVTLHILQATKAISRLWADYGPIMGRLWADYGPIKYTGHFAHSHSLI